MNSKDEMLSIIEEYFYSIEYDAYECWQEQVYNKLHNKEDKELDEKLSRLSIEKPILDRIKNDLFEKINSKFGKNEEN